MKLIKTLAILFLLNIVLFSCTKSKYDTLVKQESSKNIVLDSLLFNLHFGNTKQDFFNRCKELNQQGIAFAGQETNYAQTVLKSKQGIQPSIQMLFYGSFDDKNIMNGMDLLFTSDYWSAFSDKYNSDKLIPQIQDSILKWYPGNTFIPIKIPNNKHDDAYVKVDGNRQFLMYVKDSQYLEVKIEDLRIKYPYKYN